MWSHRIRLVRLTPELLWSLLQPPWDPSWRDVHCTQHGAMKRDLPAPALCLKGQNRTIIPCISPLQRPTEHYFCPELTTIWTACQLTDHLASLEKIAAYSCLWGGPAASHRWMGIAHTHHGKEEEEYERILVEKIELEFAPEWEISSLHYLWYISQIMVETSIYSCMEFTKLAGLQVNICE